ncbi:TPA: hypothetical protein ACX6QB_001900 [Photobacterium damselae]
MTYIIPDIIIITISIISLLYSFYIAPFKPHQVVLFFILFSFGFRPFFTSMCDAFRPFYRFDLELYSQGVYLSLIYVIFFIIPIILYSRRVSFNKDKLSINILELEFYLKLITLIVLLTVFACFLVYGKTILPGYRTVGLSLVAPGSQVYYAIVSTLSPIAISILFFLMLNVKVKIQYILYLFLLLILTMIFNQRGSIINGCFIGLFLSATFSRKIFFKNGLKKIIVILAICLFSLYSRVIILDIVSSVFNDNNSMQIVSNANKESFSCKIAMTPNQEHDQVWPVALMYIEQHGNDMYKSIYSSIFRPFYSLDDRETMGIMTVNDQLNIFNDRINYLTLNFGFSLPGMIYQYFSIGYFFIFSSFFISLVIVKMENKIRLNSMGIKSVIVVCLLFNFVNFITGPWDDNLKWFMFTTILIFLFYNFSKVFFYRLLSKFNVDYI